MVSGLLVLLCPASCAASAKGQEAASVVAMAAIRLPPIHHASSAHTTLDRSQLAGPTNNSVVPCLPESYLFRLGKFICMVSVGIVLK
jgi:hypothetical protein